MIEAVGKEFLPTYFATLDRVLRTDRGLAVVQVITMPEARYESYGKSADFIQRYIFPGGFLPSVTALVDATLEGSKGKIVVEQIENIGPRESWRDCSLVRITSYRPTWLVLTPARPQTTLVLSENGVVVSKPRSRAR